MKTLKNIRHETAIQAYLRNGGNQSAAYREAYPKSVKWKENVVAKRAYELFNRGDVLGRLSEIQNDIDIQNRFELETILDGFARIAFANITDLFDIEGDKIKLKAQKLSDLPREITDCIQSIKQTREGLEVKLYSKDAALSSIAKLKGYFTEKLQIQNTTSLADLLR